MKLYAKYGPAGRQAPAENCRALTARSHTDSRREGSQLGPGGPKEILQPRAWPRVVDHNTPFGFFHFFFLLIQPPNDGGFLQLHLLRRARGRIFSSVRGACWAGVTFLLCPLLARKLTLCKQNMSHPRV